MNTANASEALAGYQRSVEALGEGKCLGVILWFSINRPRITVEEMKAWFIELGLDEAYLPNPIKSLDAFRNATGDAKADYTLSPDLSARLFFEETLANRNMVQRQVTRSLRDHRQGTVTHDKVGEFVYYKPPRDAKSKGGEKVRSAVRTDALNGKSESQQVERLLDRTFDAYKLNCQFPTANAVRGTIRDYVIALNSIRVRHTGGVYFVHRSRQSTVDRLQTFVGRFNNGSTLHTLPLVDTGEQREMLADSLETHIEEACGKLLESVATLNDRFNKGELPATEYVKAKESYDELKDRAREYTEILQLGLGSAGTALEAALDGVMDLATKIKP